MNRRLAAVAAIVLLAAIHAAASAAVIVDAPFTNTSQIQSAANNTLFGSMQNLAALNVHYGSWPAGGTLNGVAFHDVAVVSNGVSPQNTAAGVASPAFAPGVTVDYDFSGGGDNRQLTSSVITGPDAVVATNIVHDNRYFGIPPGSPHKMTFHGLGANQSVYVQLLGGQHNWNRNTTVYANNVLQGTWQSNKTNATTGLLGFRGRADAAGDFVVELRTDQYGGMAAAILSATDPLPDLPVMQGLNYWLDASNLDALGNATVTDGAAVNRWTDLATGNDAIVRPSTADTAPVFVANGVNGRPAVRFDNGSDRLTSPATSNWGTVFLVNSIDPGPVDIMGIAGAANADLGIRWNTSADPRWRGNTSHTNSGDLTGNGGQGKFYVNSRYTDLAAIDSWHALTAMPLSPRTITGPQIGGFNNGAYGREFLGEIAEMVIYDRALNPTEQLWVGKYLADKYALPLNVDERLTNTNQVVVDPFGDGSPLHLAVNFRYSTPEVTGTLNGLRFDNINLSGPNGLKGPFTLSANGMSALFTVDIPGIDNTPRTQNVASTVSGPDEATLEAVLGEYFYVGFDNHTPSVLTFSGLHPGLPVYVQLLGGDAGWNGDMLVLANGQTVGTWTDAADGNSTTASLFGFFATVDNLGKLELNLSIASGNHAGLAGIILTERVPEPSTFALLVLGMLALAVAGRRTRRLTTL